MLELRNVSYCFEQSDESCILKDINIKLEPKKIYAITGPNGGGKTSLAKLIMGINKVTEGSIHLNGQDITDLDISERAKLGIGYSFQMPPKFKGIKVGELLELAAKTKGKEVNVCDILYNVGLCAQEYLERDLDSGLSGGEMKRIEIATLLTQDLTVAIFDEPEAGIDLWSFQKLTETFEEMHQNSDTTILIISHQQRILNLADEIILMVDGHVQENISKDRLLNSHLDKDWCLCSVNCEKGVSVVAE